jgi:hypothetical protein
VGDGPALLSLLIILWYHLTSTTAVGAQQTLSKCGEHLSWCGAR